MRRPSYLILAAAGLCCAQDFTQRGYIETRLTLYPQTAPNDSGRAVGEAFFQYEASYKPASHWRFSGALDAATDTHRMTERTVHLSWHDREIQRPAFAVRRLSAAYTRGRLTLEAGKQLIRWGKTDILNPTDRFAARDYLNVVRTSYLGVTAARAQYASQSDSIEAVYTPFFTPSRIPLLNQRWAGIPEGIAARDGETHLPGGPQFGVRWNHIAAGGEFSFSYFDGYNHQPLIGGTLALQPAPVVLVDRFYPRIRTAGADAALPLKPFTLRAEAAWFRSTLPDADEYVLYVAELERQVGEFSLLAGYAGEAVTHLGGSRNFDAERGLARSFLGRAGYTLDPSRSIAAEFAIRQNGDGVLLKGEYTQAIGAHWRATASLAWIHGADTDFLGRYHYNSFAALTLRYSF